jgi:hypothetical protein
LAPSIFEEADTYSQISVIEKCQNQSQSDSIDVYRFVADEPELIVNLPDAVRNGVVEHERIGINRLKYLPEQVFAPRYMGLAADIVDKCRKLGDDVGRTFNIEQLIRIGSEKTRKKLIVNRRLHEKLPDEARRIIDADELSNWLIDWEGRYLLYRPLELYNPKTPEIFEMEKIFIKDTSSRLVAVPDFGENTSQKTEKWYYALNTAYALIPKERNRQWVAYVAACLNSKLLDVIYKNMFGALTIRGGYIRFREYIQYLPIRRISFTTHPERRTKLVGQSSQLYERCVSKSSCQCVLEFVTHHLLQQPEESDIVYDLLVFLAEEMIRLNKLKQTETKRFIAWLEKQARISDGIDHLSGKTIIKNYLGDYQKDEPETPFEKILNVLENNQRKLGVNLSQRGLLVKLQKEYEASLTELLPIKERLAVTDKLIGQVVYKLYGLTEKEILVIEESAEK